MLKVWIRVIICQGIKIVREKRCYTNKLWKVNSTTLMDHIDIEYPLGGKKKKPKLG